jgi:site-specific DNA-methyltransferase (adenine-specific)
MSYQVLQGDCLHVLKTLPDNSVDSVVADPPYGLAFMGKKWDYDVPGVEVWAECLRVLKPGGHLLAFAGTRTQHRMACRIEDAGFDIRDMIAWVYGSGFPKSHNGEWGGTALKPALEPITMARKPLIGTVYENWAALGTGALNIDGCRVSTDDKLGGGNTSADVDRTAKHEGWKRPWMDDPVAAKASAERSALSVARSEALGRWPANLIHDGSDEVLAAFPNAPGQLADASTNADARKTQNTYGAMRKGRGDEASADSENTGAVGFKMKPGARRMDTGSAARFFYCAKASKKDRGEGNNHPTVKPTDLMRYLCRLVTPQGGVVLDPFLGSGTTGKAAMLEGFRFIGIEMDAAYAALAEKRIAAVAPDWRVALGLCEETAA